jgi:hypothetical protein
VVRLIASFRAGRNATAYGETRRFVGGFFFARVKPLSRPLVTSVFMRQQFVTYT